MTTSSSPARQLPRRCEPLSRLIDSLSEAEAAAVRAWLDGPAATDEGYAFDPLAFLRGREPSERLPSRPHADDPRAIRRVGVIGGGTAGYFTALALQAKRPWLDISVVESASIPIIGVGESTVQSIVPFLHHVLGITPAELYKRVRPTWKLGIRFEWGPDPEGFMAPFDWSANSIGLLGSLATQGNINSFTLQSLLMAAERTPVYRINGEYVSHMKYLPFSYHLDNRPFVEFLAETAADRDIRHVDALIDDVVLARDDWVDHVRTADGRQLQFDFYVDCTGFRSLLLGRAMGTPYRSYASSLFTDGAVIGTVPHGGNLKPYTTAATMDAGWCWNIPTRDSDHVGYVYSSGALSADDAADELVRKHPDISDLAHIRFRTGRHDLAWRGNVMAVGNSYAFVEPLESSSLLMITLMAMTLSRCMPTSWSEPSGNRAVINTSLAKKWDALRWFLAVHYRFNTRLDTPFWRDARTQTDVSGIQPLLEVYSDGAPVQLRDVFTRAALRASVRTFYDLQAFDCILLGQRAPTRILPMTEPVADWQGRKTAAAALVQRALPQAEALDAYDRYPRLLAETLQDPDSWAGPSQPIRLV